MAKEEGFEGGVGGRGWRGRGSEEEGLKHRVPTPTPLPLREGRQVGIILNEEIAPPPPHWDRQAIQPNHFKFRTCSALVPM